MDIKYQIEFFSDWHCGSGLGAGADVDALVVKDANGLPYIPGKTIKGLVRQALEEIIFFKGLDLQKKVNDNFGYFDGSNPDSMKRGDIFFTNAELPEAEQNVIIKENLPPYLFRSVASTAIDKDGIAVENSLRKIEVVIPCKLEGKILNVDPDLKEPLVESLKFIKRLGIDRNRGLGRCSFHIIPVSDDKITK